MRSRASVRVDDLSPKLRVLEKAMIVLYWLLADLPWSPTTNLSASDAINVPITPVTLPNTPSSSQFCALWSEVATSGNTHR